MHLTPMSTTTSSLKHVGIDRARPHAASQPSTGLPTSCAITTTATTATTRAKALGEPQHLRPSHDGTYRLGRRALGVCPCRRRSRLARACRTARAAYSAGAGKAYPASADQQPLVARLTATRRCARFSNPATPRVTLFDIFHTRGSGEQQHEP